MIGSIGAIIGGVVYAASGFKDFLTLGWPQLPELMMFSLAGASILLGVLDQIRKRE